MTNTFNRNSFSFPPTPALYEWGQLFGKCIYQLIRRYQQLCIQLSFDIQNWQKRKFLCLSCIDMPCWYWSRVEIFWKFYGAKTAEWWERVLSCCTVNVTNAARKVKFAVIHIRVAGQVDSIVIPTLVIKNVVEALLQKKETDKETIFFLSLCINCLLGNYSSSKSQWPWFLDDLTWYARRNIWYEKWFLSRQA